MNFRMSVVVNATLFNVVEMEVVEMEVEVVGMVGVVEVVDAVVVIAATEFPLMVAVARSLGGVEHLQPTAQEILLAQHRHLQLHHRHLQLHPLVHVEAAIETMEYVLMAAVARSMGGVELPLPTVWAILLVQHLLVQHLLLQLHPLVHVEAAIEAMKSVLTAAVARSLGGAENLHPTAQEILLAPPLLAPPLLLQLHPMEVLAHAIS